MVERFFHHGGTIFLPGWNDSSFVSFLFNKGLCDIEKKKKVFQNDS